MCLHYPAIQPRPSEVISAGSGLCHCVALLLESSPSGFCLGLGCSCGQGFSVGSCQRTNKTNDGESRKVSLAEKAWLEK